MDGRLILAAAAALVGGNAPATDVSSRPHIHFTPERNWLNDPNGLVYLDGEYHLFFQHNPHGTRWGHMSWGHAVSRDMLRWQELPLAIAEDEHAMIYSGSVVHDAANTSGFGTAGRAPLVAIFTAHRQAPARGQAQHLAFSLDKGRTWTKYPGNPVLDLGLEDFRDPKVIWHATRRQWIMVVALPKQQRVAFFGSPDLKQWTRLSEFAPPADPDEVWECPDLLLLPVDNRPGERLWVLKVDAHKSKTAPGAGGQYFVGHFDGERFTAIDPAAGPRGLDHGPDFYAAMSWSNIPARDRRTLWLGWMSNWAYAQDVPSAPWRGAMSIPRQLSLRATADGYVLRQAPIRELDRLLDNRRRIGPTTVRDAAAALPVSNLPMDLTLRLTPAGAGEAGLRLRSTQGVEATLGYLPRTGELFVERPPFDDSASGKRFGGRSRMTVPAAAGSLNLRVIVDQTSIEVFADEETRIMTVQLVPKAPISSLAFYAMGGGAALNGLAREALGLRKPGK